MMLFYLDNFRGFQNTCVPILDVNFCVGENSTGKTSLLHIIHLFSSQKFWHETNFEGIQSSLGHYDEIVSINATNRNYFRVGVAEVLKNSKTKENTSNSIFACMLTFVKKDGMPKIYKISMCFGVDLYTLILTDNSIRYKVTKLDDKISLDLEGSLLLNKIAETHASKNQKGFKNLKKDRFSISRMPPLFLLSYIREREDRDPDKDDERFYFGVPVLSLHGDVAWLAPIRTEPKRTYDEIKLDFSPQGEHIPYVVKKILDSGDKVKEFQTFVNKFGKDSGLFNGLKVHTFGDSITSPFELEIVLDTKPLNISSVGYGVSQGLPVVVEFFVRGKGSWFIVQQPEVHLHPKAQAAIGDIIFGLANTEDKKFIVETHSDFTIDRYRMNVRKNKHNQKGQVLFFERIKGFNIVHSIEIDRSGELSDDQPKSYRDFFLKEGLDVIGI